MLVSVHPCPSRTAGNVEMYGNRRHPAFHRQRSSPRNADYLYVAAFDRLSS